MMSGIVRFRPLCAALGLLASSGCSGDDGGGDNVLPTATSTSSGTSDTAGTAGSGGATDTGPVGNVFPATYRFTCIDIQQIGQSDGTVLQANLLETQWQADIDDYKLSILADVLERDEAAGTSTLQIRSGIGTGDDDICTDAATESVQHPSTFDGAAGAYGPSNDPDLPCSDASTEVMGGTYQLVTTNMDVFHIYAQDDDGTTFNCTPDQNTLDAVPVRAVTATFTQNEEGTRAWGSLTGCLVESEAEELCSCLGQCVGDGHENCVGCPTGSLPLRTLLGNIQPDQECSDTMGVPAFNITLGFTADLLPAVPGTCG